MKKYTTHSFELIIIDNHSTDGSREYLEEKGATIIRNEQNYSYPYCQNQGIVAATTDWMFFLNNDLILSPRWDEILMEVAKRHQLDVVSASGIENLGNKKETQAIDRKWKRTKNPLSILGFGKRNLAAMHRLMYGNWETFCRKVFQKNGRNVVEGIVGNNVLITRRGIDILGKWDERIQEADFDLYMRAKKRSMENGDIKPCHIALGAYIHHFGKMTIKYGVKPKPFHDREKILRLDQKWSAVEIDEMHPNNSTIRKK